MRRGLIYARYQSAKISASKKSRKICLVLAFIAAVLCGGTCGVLAFSERFSTVPFPAVIAAGGLSLIFLAIGMIAALQNKGVKRDLSYSTKLLPEIFSRHLADSTLISQEAMNAFCQRMGEYRRLCAALIKSEETARILAKELDDLQAQQTACTEVIETAAAHSAGS